MAFCQITTCPINYLKRKSPLFCLDGTDKNGVTTGRHPSLPEPLDLTLNRTRGTTASTVSHEGKWGDRGCQGLSDEGSNIMLCQMLLAALPRVSYIVNDVSSWKFCSPNAMDFLLKRR